MSEKGKYGEKFAAKEKLDRLCKKYNIIPEEIIINEETNDYYIIIKDQNERELLVNVCCMVLDIPGFKWRERNNCVCIHVTKLEYEDIHNAFEYYKEMYNDYKRYLMQGIISRHAIGYIPKHQTYTQENIQNQNIPTPKSEDTGKGEKQQDNQEKSKENKTENKKSEDKSEDVVKPIDPIKLMKIAVALDKKPWIKPDPNKKLIE